jgi:hypothetical protein
VVGPSQTTAGTRTAVARSGRDGHAIWKSPVDRWESWFDPNGARKYELSAFPLPAGDLDGDGTPDVIATGRAQAGPVSKRRQARLPIEVLSGRTGARVWSAGPLPVRSGVPGLAEVNWTEARKVEAQGAPDLVVCYSVGPVSRLARVSGRDGRIVWDVSLAQNTIASLFRGTLARVFDDLDGDGGIDAVIVLPSFSTAGDPGFDFTMVVVSLRDGKQLWSQTLGNGWPDSCQIRIGDVDGDKRPDIVSLEAFPQGTRYLRIRVFDGRDGKVRWNWSPDAEQYGLYNAHLMVLADFDGRGTHDVCVNFKGPRRRQIVVLDGNGKERMHRDVVDDDLRDLQAADLDGDGRDELLVSYGGLVRAWDRDLKELRCWPSRVGRVDRVVPASAGRPREVIFAPGGGFDAETGQPRWADQAPLVESPPQFLLKVLDPGGSKRLPLLVGNGLGATVCRVAMPTSAGGSIAPLRGDRAQIHGRAREDPRWGRALPWFSWLTGALGPWSFLAVGGLALVNVGLPLLILWLAARKRRQFNIRSLMVLPLAAAVPLMTFLTLAPSLELWPAPWLFSEKAEFIAGTLAGIPIVYYVLWMGGSLVRRRWRFVLALLGLTVAATLAVAGGWLWLDRKSMAAIEHYRWEGWELVLLPGAYFAAVLWAGWRAIHRAYGLVRRRPVGESI